MKRFLIRCLAVGALLLSGPVDAIGAITFDVANSFESNGTTTGDSFTGPVVSAGSNRVAVVEVCLRAAGANSSVSAITYDGVTMTQAVNKGQFPMRVTKFYVINPPTGTSTVSYSLTQLARVTVGVEIFQGVKITDVVGNTQTAGGSANTSTLNYTTVADDSFLLDCFCQANEPVLTEVSPQTEHWEITVTGGGPASVKPTGAGSSRATGTAGSFSTQYDSDSTEDFAYAGFELKAFVASTGVPLDVILNGVPADLLVNGVPVDEINN